MTDGQRDFIRGPASRSFVLALMIASGAGGGFMLHQNSQFTADEAQRLANARDKYEALEKSYIDLAHHCEEREVDAIRGAKDGR